MGKRRGREGGRGGGGGFEDQYGGGMTSQDRDGGPSFGGRGAGGGGSGGGFTGGGEAGGSKKDSNVLFIRSVPKFLQGHMHHLGRKAPQEEEEAQLASMDEEALQKEDDRMADERDQQEALEQAVRENPELAQQYPELQSVANAAAAVQCKEAGNQAFVSARYEDALLHFSKALSLKEDPIYYSNRAASYHALKRYREAAEDARRVVALDSKWVKGWSRLAAALFAMEEWSEAKDAYAQALELEPSDRALQSMWHMAEVNETKQEAEGSVTFKRSRTQGATKAAKPGVAASHAPTAKKKSLLSFDAEEDEEM